MTTPPYEFADLRLDVGQRRVWCGAEQISLTRRTFALLRLLVERAPNLVSHAEITDYVWGPRRVVTPENLAQHVSMLRRALGDDAAAPRYIEVIRGEGYRLVPGVRVGTGEAPPTEPRTVRFTRSARFLALGTAALAAVTVIVIAMLRPDPGAALFGGDDLRPLPSAADNLVRELVHGGEGHEGPTFDPSRAPPQSRQAYDLYLEAIEWMGQPVDGAYAQARRLLEDAVRLEPDFAHAYAMAAWLHARSLIHTTNQNADSNSDPLAVERLVVENVERALALDPGLGRAYIPLADLYESAWRWDEARDAYLKAEALTPEDPYVLFRFGWFSSFTGNHLKAIDLSKRAIGVQPEFFRGWADLGLAQLYAGDMAAALEALDRAAALEAGRLEVRLLLGIVEAARGNAIVAEAQLRSVERLLGEARLLADLPRLAVGYALLERPDDVARLVAEIEGYDRGRDVGAGAGVRALAYLAAGDGDRASQWLEAAIENTSRHERDPGYYELVSIKRNLFGLPILETHRFRELRARLGTSGDQPSRAGTCAVR